MLFPTSVVGSMPRPQWVLDVMDQYLSGRLPRDQVRRLLDPAVQFVVSVQEIAGIDIVTDGEWRREGYFQVFYDRVRGFQPDLIQGRLRSWPAVVEPLEYHNPIVSEDARFLVNYTDRRTKVTLPTPYVIGRRFYSPQHSRNAYATREDFMEAVADILRIEIEELIKLQVDVIQFDDPMIGYFVDPAYRNKTSGHTGVLEFTDWKEELEVAVASLNGMIRGFPRELFALHICRGNIQRRSDAVGDFTPVLPYIYKTHVHQLVLEFAMPEAGSIDVLKGFPDDKLLGLGVVDVRKPEKDPVEVLIKRVEKAMQYVDRDRIILNPDCGFAPSSDNPIPLIEAYAKLKGQAEAAVILREKYGSG